MIEIEPLPDDYPDGADLETVSLYWASKAPPLSPEKLETLRALLKPPAQQSSRTMR